MVKIGKSPKTQGLGTKADVVDGKTRISELLNRFSCSVRVEHYHVGNVSGKILHHKVGVVSAELPLPNATTAYNKCRQ